jgi:hypothetical protein
MRITVSQLRRIIKEEVQRSILREGAAKVKNRDVENFILDHGPNAAKYAESNKYDAQITSWFEDNGNRVPDLDAFRAAVLAHPGLNDF